MDRLFKFHGIVLFLHLFAILFVFGYITISPFEGIVPDPRYLFVLAPMALCFVISVISIMNYWVAPVRVGFLTAIVLSLVYVLAIFISNPELQKGGAFFADQETASFMLLGFWLYALLFSAGVLVSAIIIPRRHLEY
ncbi:MAG: hypothetical protein ACK5P5_00820 [Pseudobdellovibrionaceae bacterium]